MIAEIKTFVNRIKIKKPVILNLTNTVTMDFVANGLLSLGASPVMSHASDEMLELIGLANAVTINLGTLDDRFISLCNQACEIARRLKKPVVLDPAGAGATQYRTETALRLLEKYPIAILRGNASEIMSLSGEDIISRGVDTSADSELAIASAKSLSLKFDTVVMTSGATDYIVNGEYQESFSSGSPLMACVTGAGCLFSAVIASFHAIENCRVTAAKIATMFYGNCGSHAAKNSDGPGSFRVNFIDELSKS